MIPFKKLFFLILFLFHTIGERPRSSCDISKPFRQRNGICSDFDDVCNNKDDLECINFKKACEQCSARNYSIINKFGIMKVQYEGLKGILIATCFFNIIINLVIFGFLFKKYYPLIKRKIPCFKEHSNGSSRSDRNNVTLPLFPNGDTNETFRAIINDNNIKLLQDIKNVINEKDERYKEIINENYEKLVKEKKEINNEKEKTKVNFKVFQQDKTIQIYVNRSDNIIKLKSEICEKIGGLKQDHYKAMICKYNGVQLNDNQYLLSCLKCIIFPIYCEFCNDINPKNICVLRIEGKENLPNLLQINRSKKIKDLKEIISTFVNCTYDKLILYHKSIELETEKTIEECKLEDYSYIKARKRQSGYIRVTSILKEDKTSPIQYSDDQSIEDFKRKLAEYLKYDFNKLFLFYNGDFMNDKKIIYNYDFEENRPVEYFYPKNFDNIRFENNSMKEYLQMGTYQPTNQSILLLQRSLSKLEMKEKLLIYHHSRSHHPSLVNIIGIYQMEDSIHIAMDNIFTGTLASYLKSQEILLHFILIWTKQIISGLNYFHENGIYLGYLNPLCILVDGNQHVKILPFKTDSDHFYNKMNEKIEIKYFIENEIFENKRQPDSLCDVWSLGVILAYITTGKLPEYKFTDKNKGKIKKRYFTEIINKKEPKEYLHGFILSCMKENLKERFTLDKLMNHNFMKIGADHN